MKMTTVSSHPSCSRRRRRTAWPLSAALGAVATLLWPHVTASTFEHRQRYEDRDIAKLAAITQVDGSAMFFHGFTKSGYVRDGRFHRIDLKRPEEEPFRPLCRGEAVSSDGTRIAYALVVDDAARCRIVIHDLRTGHERTLANVNESRRRLTWSWDDTEVAYHSLEGFFAVSVADGRQRTLARLARATLRVNGQARHIGGEVQSLEWLHHRPEFVVSAPLDVPTREPGTSSSEHHVLLVSSNDSQILAVAGGAAVSPASDQIAFIEGSHVEVINADGSGRRRVANAPPGGFFLPFIKQDIGWSRVRWAPAGDRLLFDSVLDEEFNSNTYIVDIKSGKRKRVLANTSLDVTAWR
jgi:hypothetical protein